MAKNNIDEALDKLTETDVWSLMLFALWRIKEIPEYATLSELMYILDNESALRFFDYYGGQTLKVPTKQEFKNMINALLLYQYVNIEGKDFAEALKEIGSDKLKEAKEDYIKISSILSKYNFRRS